jgi:hypothetical protein
MCDAWGNQTRPSKYGRGGKTLIEAMLVRIQVISVATDGPLLVYINARWVHHVIGCGPCKRKQGLKALHSWKLQL